MTISSWYLAYGMQSVVFAWLVTLVLRELPERVGFAQMMLGLPTMLLILLAGVLADRIGPRRQAIWAQLMAALCPWALIVAIALGHFSYVILIGYALAMGAATAFVIPARDGMLNVVAGQNVQRMVVLSSLCQFGFQIIGFTLAGFADQMGAVTILVLQSVFLLVGVFAFAPLKGNFESGTRAHRTAASTSVIQELRMGASTVLTHPIMRTVVLQNVAMGLFFAGSFIVGFPLVVREVFAGSSGDLALLNALNSAGLVLTILLLLRLGPIRRAGRGLLLAQGLGSLVLLSAGLADQELLFVVLVFFWGICGGLALPMSRTLMQQLAPADQRARVMSFYSLSFLGAAPLGALLVGYLASLYGPQQAIVTAALAMLLVLIMVALVSPMWNDKLSEVAETA